MRIAILLIAFALVVSNTARAELKPAEPTVLCSYMQDVGFVTRGWKNYYENAFGCSSPYKELGTGFPLANNLAYYAEGNKETVTQLKLVLNVNNSKTANAAHEELLKASEALSIKATGANLPQPLKDAIKSGKKATAKIGSASMEVVRENWPSNKGYEIKVIIR
ncbi:MAG: hypothetical protein KF815_13465 [Rhodospirillales bacterium]|nr:hypothetical protein [Rhodospirillales bacterium]